MSAGAVVEPVDVGNQVVPGVVLRTPSRSRDAGSRSARRRAAPSRRRARRSTWIVPCVAGCDGPMLTMTSPSSLAALEGGRTGLGERGVQVGVVTSGTGTSGCSCSLRIVLAQRMADEALVEQDRAQVGVAAKDDAVHVVALALHEVRRAVQRHQRVDRRARSAGTRVFSRTRTRCVGGVEVIDDVEARRALPGQSTAVTSRNRSNANSRA